MSTKKYITKQGKYGTLYLHRFDYKDQIDPCFPVTSTTMWAYSFEHVYDRFSETNLDQGFDSLEIIRDSLKRAVAP